MNTLKKLFKFVAIGLAFCFLLFAGFFGYTYTTTSVARSMGSEFVQHTHAQQFDEAYAMLHKNLKAKLSRADFEKLVKKGRVDEVSSVSWNKWEFDNGVKTVTGTNPAGDTEVRIRVTEIENDNKPGILLFDFEPIKK